MDYSDKQLINNYLKGDEKSLEVLIERYLKPIYSFAYRYANSQQEAEDITQEVFVRMWRNLKKPALSLSKGFNPKKGKFSTWIFSIAKNAAIDSLRKKKTLSFSDFFTKKESVFGEKGEKSESVIEEVLADPGPLPEEILQRAQDAKVLDSAIKKLPLHYRTILFLYYNDHFNFREIAEILEEPLNTVKSRHRRGLIMLKKEILNPHTYV